MNRTSTHWDRGKSHRSSPDGSSRSLRRQEQGQKPVQEHVSRGRTDCSRGGCPFSTMHTHSHEVNGRARATGNRKLRNTVHVLAPRRPAHHWPIPLSRRRHALPRGNSRRGRGTENRRGEGMVIFTRLVPTKRVGGWWVEGKKILGPPFSVATKNIHERQRGKHRSGVYIRGDALRMRGLRHAMAHGQRRFERGADRDFTSCESVIRFVDELRKIECFCGVWEAFGFYLEFCF